MSAAQEHSLLSALYIIGLCLSVFATITVNNMTFLFNVAVILSVVFFSLTLYKVLAASKTWTSQFSDSLLKGWVAQSKVRTLARLLTKNASSGLLNPTSWQVGFIATLLASGTFLLLFFFVLESVVEQDTWVAVDTWVIERVANSQTPFLNRFFYLSTRLADTSTVITVTLIGCTLLAIYCRKRLAFWLAGGVIFQASIIAALKIGVGRERPTPETVLLIEDSFSFPSGHTMGAVVVFGMIAYMLYRLWGYHKRTEYIVPTYITLVVLVALSRIYLGVHYLSDVVASIFLGLFVLTTLILLGNRHYILQGN